MSFAIGIFLIIIGSVAIFAHLVKNMLLNRVYMKFINDNDLAAANHIDSQKVGLLTYAVFAAIIAVGVYLVK